MSAPAAAKRARPAGRAWSARSGRCRTGSRPVSSSPARPPGPSPRSSDDHLVAPPDQLAGGREPGEAGADDDDAHGRARSGRRAVGHVGGELGQRRLRLGGERQLARATSRAVGGERARSGASTSATARRSSTSTAWRSATSSASRSGRRRGRAGGAGAAVGPARGEGEQRASACPPGGRRRPACPVVGVVAEGAEQVVAELEGLAERAARRRTAARPARRGARPGRRPGAAAARRCTCPTCSGRCAGPPRGRRAPRAVPSRSRYWPMFSSTRSSSHTARAGRRRLGEQASA